MRLLHLFLFGLIYQFNFAQEAAYSAKKTQIIGVKSIDSHGLLVLSESSEKNSVQLSRIGADARFVWASDVEIQKLKGYRFNQVQLQYDQNFVYCLNKVDDWLTLSVFGLEDGHPVASFGTEISTTTAGSVVFTIQDSSLYQAVEFDKILHWTKSTQAIQNAAADLPVTAVLDRIPGIHAQFIAGQWLYGSSYELSKDHSKMDLHLFRMNTVTGDTQRVIHQMDLDHMSYTYNSVVDKNTLSIIQSPTAYYVLGKLDYRFKGQYPKSKLTEAFAGFWIAKFDMDMRMQYFSEIPFQYFQGLVTNDVVIKPAVIDIKEDVNGTALLTILEHKEVLYGKQYIISIDSTGKYQSFIGGQSGFNFFEYNGSGLRKAGKKCKVRLINDDFAYHRNSGLHLMQYVKGLHSPAIGNIKTLSQDNDYLPSEECYTFLTVGGQLWILEYLDTKGGKLNIYSFKAAP